MNRRFPGGLYGMADASVGDPLAQARRLARAGVGVVQLRCKGWPEDAVERLLAEVRAAGVAAGDPIWVVNDHAALARRAGTWAHLGQDDGPAPLGLAHGRSCHTLAQVEAATVAEPRPRYLGFGPVFGTGTKDTGYAPRGIALLAQAVRATDLPIVAIGGITVERLEGVRAAGARGWAVVAGIWSAADPDAAIRAFSVAPLTRQP
jgi:thiamine-phosphate pyrophosphorylase